MDTHITPISHIYLYDDPESEGLDIDYIAGSMASTFPTCRVGVRTDFITHHLGRLDEAARDSMVQELTVRLEDADPIARLGGDDILFDQIRQEDDVNEVSLYAPLQDAFRWLIPDEESGLDHLHVIFTSHLLAAIHEPLDYSLHVAALGSPSVISTSGLVEVPDRPREYYFKRAQYAVYGAEEHMADLAEDFADRTLGYGDPRLNDVLEGYVLMAVVYRASGEGPCHVPTCPLHAANTQEGVLAAQVGSESALCEHHTELIEQIARD